MWPSFGVVQHPTSRTDELLTRNTHISTDFFQSVWCVYFFLAAHLLLKNYPSLPDIFYLHHFVVAVWSPQIMRLEAICAHVLTTLTTELDTSNRLSRIPYRCHTFVYYLMTSSTRRFRGKFVLRFTTLPFKTRVVSRQIAHFISFTLELHLRVFVKHFRQNVCEQRNSFGSLSTHKQIGHCRFREKACSNEAIAIYKRNSYI